ncbi:MAG TPA: SAM-dependent chlorinase/fluorinase [Actinomycetota bacterium]|nr:SAM-dependent chlorinase/fluorinase [Actinomycetota bacterium]
MALAFRFITFLSDYGLEDEFVGVCRGVIKRFAPEVEIIDIAHGVPPQDVRAGATVLAQAVPYMPPAVHLAVVDPGVGTGRRAVVIGTAAGPPLIGPDNGLLWQAAEALGGPTQAFSIENRELFLPTPSRTFHGRDIFAPVAGRLALGMPPEEVGPPLPVESLVRLETQPPKLDDDHIHARIIQIDHFGNLQLNVHRQDLEGIGVMLGDSVEVRIGGRSFMPVYGQAFGEAGVGKLILLEDSYRWMTIGANQGNASRLVEAHRGDAVVLARVQRGAQ